MCVWSLLIKIVTPVPHGLEWENLTLWYVRCDAQTLPVGRSPCHHTAVKIALFSFVFVQSTVDMKQT